MLLVWVLFLATAVEALPGGGGRQLTKENQPQAAPAPPSSPAPEASPPFSPSPPSSPSPEASTSKKNKPPATSGTWNRCKNECYKAGKCKCDVAGNCKGKANGKAYGLEANSKASCDKCVGECINP